MLQGNKRGKTEAGGAATLAGKNWVTGVVELDREEVCGVGACYRGLIWLPLPHDLCFSKLIGFQSLISLLFFVLLLLKIL